MIIFSPNMIKAILSDYDGVLIPDEYRGIRTLCPDVTLLERIESAYYATATCTGLWEELRNAFALKESDDELRMLYNTEDDEQRQFEARVLDRYREIQGDCLLLLLSNQITDRANYLRARNHLGCFDTLYFSNELGLQKPNPAIFALVLARHNLSPEEVIFIDDAQENIDAASALGMQTIHFTGIESLDRIRSLLS